MNCNEIQEMIEEAIAEAKADLRTEIELVESRLDSVESDLAYLEQEIQDEK